LKSDEVQASVGSNPTFSVKETLKIDTPLYFSLRKTKSKKIDMLKKA